MIDLTPLINVLILLVATLVSVYLIPWIKTKKTAQEIANLQKWAKIAVAAAQQLFHEFDGETRLNHALAVMAEKGFDIDTIEVRNAVEAEVLKLHQQLEEAA